MGMGGGLIRDLLLNVTPATLQSNWYLLTAVAAAPVGLREPKVALRIIRKVVQAASTGAALAVMAVTQAVAPILRTMALKVRSLS